MQDLERALTVHEQWLAAGRPVPPEQLLAAHPALAEFLRALLADRGELDRAVAAADGEERVLGDFRILGEIGRGGMGVVYRARQRSLDREVALKVLPAHVTLQASSVARFRREATLAARLEHPNIVAIHAIGRDGDAHFFAMECIDGTPLARLDPATGQPRSVRSCVELCAAVADALAHAHAQGVLHRDVKPSNILVRTDGRPVLTDFGLARDLEEPGLTRSGVFAGTPHYSSPEQAAGSRAIDARADVWSLGATLYELLTGRLPFDGDSTPAIIDRIVRSEPPDPLRLSPELSPDLAAIVLKALEKDPARRYQTAAAFAADLRAFLEFRPVSARRTTAWLRLRRWMRREPLRAALAAVLVLGVPTLALVAGILIANRDAMAVGARELRRQEQEERLARLTIDLEAGDYEAAMASAQLAIAERPDDIEAHALRALVQVYAGREAEALAELEASIAERRLPSGDRARVLVLTAMHRADEALAAQKALAEPRTPEELFLDGSIATLRGQEQLLDVAAWRRVRDTFLRAMLLSPQPRLHYYLKWAGAVNWIGDAAETAQCNAVLLGLWPDSPASLLYVAFSLRRSEPLRAVELYRQVLAAGHDHPRIHTSIADCLANAGQTAEAKAAREQGVAAYERRARDGRLGDAERLNLAINLEQVGRRTDAIAAAREVLARQPAMGRAHRILGWLLGLDQDHAGAIAAFEASLRTDPDDAQTLQRLGQAYMQAGQPARAAEVIRRVCALLPNDPYGAHHLALALYAAGDFPGAVAANQRSVELSPKVPQFHFNLGLAARAAGDPAAARRAFEAALALRPQYDGARSALADLLAGQGDLAGALAAAREGVAATPESASAWEALGKQLLATGERQEAAAALREAVARAVATPVTVAFLRGIAAKAGEVPDQALARQALQRALEFTPTAAEREEIERQLAQLGH